MSAQEKIAFLESRITQLENENLTLKSMLKQQANFGNKMTQIISEMDELLGKKKLEIESLTNQLLVKPNINKMTDFSIDLGESEPQLGFLEYQKQLKLKKRIARKRIREN